MKCVPSEALRSCVLSEVGKKEEAVSDAIQALCPFRCHETDVSFLVSDELCVFSDRKCFFPPYIPREVYISVYVAVCVIVKLS